MTRDLEAMHRRAAALRAEADRKVRQYDRTSWIRYLAYFSAAPMFVVVFRLQMEIWGYVFALGLYVGLGLAMSIFDGAIVQKRDAALAAAAVAEKDCKRARVAA